MSPKNLLRAACAISLLAFAAYAPLSAATTYNVSTLANLQAKINAAQPGDTILVASGTYNTTPTALTITSAGTPNAPITITAQTSATASAPGTDSVVITGTGGITIKNSASYIVLSGLTFKQQAGQFAINSPAHHIRITRSVFACATPAVIDESVSYHFLRLTADDIEIDHNEFRDKAIIGNMINIYGPTGSTQVGRRAWIHHNYFHDVTPYLIGGVRANGGETIRYGVSGVSLSTGGGLVEYNLFERCTGDVEIISNKSCGNTYRYNTLLDCPASTLTLRHGNDCIVYGNILRNTDGIRVYGDRHLVYSNYLERNTTGLQIGNGDIELSTIPSPTATDLTGHDRPDNCVFAFNTLVSNTVAYKNVTNNGGPLGATNTIFANNIILQTSGTVIALPAPNATPTWTNNYYWGSGNTTGLPGTGFTRIDPQLTADAQGIYRPAASSPAIAAAITSGTYSDAVIYDMSGRLRPATAKTLGADETTSTSTRTACLLTAADVGLNATAPVITNFSPTTFASTSTTTVIITGSNFSAVTAVYFANTPAANYTVNTATQITATSPDAATLPASGNLLITTINGTGTSPAAFTVPPTPPPPPPPAAPTNLAPLVSQQIVAASHSVTLTASATGNPAPTFQWQISTDNGATWSNIPASDSRYTGTTTATLTITNATSDLTNTRYRYTASNSVGQPATSNALTLNVTTSAFGNLTAIAADASHTLYVADSSQYVVWKITPSNEASILAGQLNTPGTSDNNANNSPLYLTNPTALAIIPSSGELLIGDTSKIFKVTATGSIFRISTNAPTTPGGIAFTTTGTAYLTDTAHSQLTIMSPAGTAIACAGTYDTPGTTESTALNAQFRNPTGIAIDTANHLYIADTGNSTIRTLASDGRYITYAGTPGVTGTTDGDILSTHPLLNNPRGLALDPANNLYIADTGNSTIRLLTPDGELMTIAGRPGVSGLSDGAGTRALFDHPAALAYSNDSGTSTLYIADTGNSLIRKLTLATGEVTTLLLTTATTTGTTTGTTSGTTSGTTGNNNNGSTTSNTTSNSGGGGGSPTLYYLAALAALFYGRAAFPGRRS